MEDVTDVKNKYGHLLKCTFVRQRLSLLEKVQMDFLGNKKSHKNIDS